MEQDLVKALYCDILNQVLLLEGEKKSVGQGILMIKSRQDRLPLFKRYLNLEICKHRLLEQAVIAALQNGNEEVLAHVAHFYPQKDLKKVLDKIRSEINANELLKQTIEKALKRPECITFVERRALQEINKYIVEQAREYLKVEYPETK